MMLVLMLLLLLRVYRMKIVVLMGDVVRMLGMQMTSRRVEASSSGAG